jgi:hypothetical protein
MGTVQKILQSLNRISDDKKGQLTARYVEHSSWMRSELDLIRSLIKKNPRDDHPANDENIAPVDVPAVNSSSNRLSGEKHEDEHANRHKRKSPEMGILGSRNSPDLKRNSTQDYEELATSAGLPTDLNRLKKEHLLEELESRGNNTFSMKSLKKDLVDALKDALLKCSKETKTGDMEPREISERLEADVSEGDAPVTVMSNDYAELAAGTVESNTENAQIDGEASTKVENVKKVRSGSLMAEFRSLINNPVQSVESESDRAAKIQNEYQARQQRHRQSRTVKLSETQGSSDDPSSLSQSLIASGVVDLTEGTASSSKSAEVSQSRVAGQTNGHPTGTMDLVFSPQKAQTQDLCPQSPAVASSVMDLGSPSCPFPVKSELPCSSEHCGMTLCHIPTVFGLICNLFLNSSIIPHLCVGVGRSVADVLIDWISYAPLTPPCLLLLPLIFLFDCLSISLSILLSVFVFPFSFFRSRIPRYLFIMKSCLPYLLHHRLHR